MHKLISIKIIYFLRYTRLFRKLISKYYDYKGLTLQKNLEKLNDAENVKIDWPKDKKKPIVGIVKDFNPYQITHRSDYWPKYQKYLKYNDIPYDFFHIFNADWIENAKKYDIIVWHTGAEPWEQWDAKSKIYFLEKYMGKKCFPSFNEIWFYEEKIRQNYLFKKYEIPCIKTFISQNELDAINFINKTSFPIVSKINTGSGSKGVELIKTRRKAKKYIYKIFGKGKKTYWPYLKQKNYVYFQEFIKDAKYDLRIVIIGNKFFGYYRLPSKKDFCASGSGIIEKKTIPEDALLFAKNVKDKLNTTMLAVDILETGDPVDKYKMIETSIFIRIDTAEQLKINGVPGYYEYSNGSFNFKSGKYWIQELALNEYLLNWIKYND